MAEEHGGLLISPILFLSLPIDGHRQSFYFFILFYFILFFFAVWNSAAVNICVDLFSVLWGIFLGVELLNPC